MKWKKYPEFKPEASDIGRKIFYYVQVDDEWFKDVAIKCWYKNDHWLSDGMGCVVKKVTVFSPAPRNGKIELDLSK